MKRLLAFVSILLLVSAACAQDATAPAVPLKAVWNRSAIPLGEGATLGVVFSVPAKHHITDVAFGLFTVTVPDTLGLDFSEPVFPQGVSLKEDEVCYRGRVVVTLPVTATDSAKPGTYKIPVAVAYQMCQEFGNEVCFLPAEKTIELTATIVPAGTAVTAANAEAFAPQPAGTQAMSLDERLTAALNKGSWLAFLLVFVGGILASFTPCVYPVIPITIGYIGGASRSKLHGLGLAAIFVIGIAFVYSTLGLISAATGSLFGSISGSPLVTYAVAVIFAVMGISMLGAFEIALPSSVQSKLQSGSPRKGLIAPLVLGMVSGLVMAPCVGPVIVALLAWVAQTHNLLLGWSLLFVFSLGLGVLFLVIGAFAGAIKGLPRAGAWMDGIKHGFGWLLLAAALYLLRLSIPQPWFWFAWVVLLAVFSVFMIRGGVFKKPFQSVMLVIFWIAAIVLLIRSEGAPWVRHAPVQGITWQVNQEEEAVAAARRDGKPLLVDVYADWCVACVELDEKTYVVPDVIARTQNFVRLKLDFTKQTPWVEAMKLKYGITGMPTVILYNPAGEEVTRFTGFKSSRDFLALLDQHKL